MMGNRRDIWLSVIVLLVLDIFIGALITSTLVFCGTEERRYKELYTFPQFCLTCSDLTLHPDDEHVGIDAFNNETLCCASNKSYIPQLVDQYTGHWLKEQIYQENPKFRGCKSVEFDPKAENEKRNNPSKEFIKIQGYENQRLNVTNLQRVQWDKSTLISSSNIRYGNGYVTIEVKGMYQIYSQVITEFTRRITHVKGAPNLFMHGIALRKNYNNAQEKLIIASTLSQCKTKPENAYAVSHIESVFQFNKGDKLLVKVSFPEDLTPSSKMNYFGVHMI